MRVVWRRKRIDAFIEDGKLNTIQTMVYMLFALFLGNYRF